MQPGHDCGAGKFFFCRGQAMIESCIVILFLCLLFLGLFQFTHAHVSHEVLNYAAARAARAKTVGFNRWMVEKTLRVAAIPNSGRLLEPAVPGGDPALDHAVATLGPGALWDFALHSASRSPTIDAELARIPEFMASANRPRGEALLNYERWDPGSPNRLDWDVHTGAGAILDPTSGTLITVQVSQYYDLLLPLDALDRGEIGEPVLPGDRIRLRGEYNIEDHYSLYLEDEYR